MDSEASKVLTAIHAVDNRVQRLETKIDDGVNGRFKDIERRIAGIEAFVKWIVYGIIGAVLAGVLAGVVL